MAESKGGGGVSASHGQIWLIGWLFTIAYAHLHPAKAILALIVWPYFLGTAVAGR
jgi:hypothetical protein